MNGFELNALWSRIIDDNRKVVRGKPSWGSERDDEFKYSENRSGIFRNIIYQHIYSLPGRRSSFLEMPHFLICPI